MFSFLNSAFSLGHRFMFMCHVYMPVFLTFLNFPSVGLTYDFEFSEVHIWVDFSFVLFCKALHSYVWILGFL